MICVPIEARLIILTLLYSSSMFWYDLVGLKSEPKGYIWSGVARPFTRKRLSIRDYERRATRVCPVWNRSQLKKISGPKIFIGGNNVCSGIFVPHNICTP